MKRRISVNPRIHFGKPCIANTRITVQNVFELNRDGIPFNKIIDDYYPEIKVEDIQACIQYAIDIIMSEDIKIETEAA
ncbi:MAG: DUF433 domain-containing protein [Deltaproteobacteria bacterium]|nr:DUF433 domain-containing protein [Deltaproteobacteria bacterium]